MGKKVWVLNHYAGDTFFDKGGRHYSFAKYLRKAGYELTIFCCNAVHGKPEYYFDFDGLWQKHKENDIDVDYVFVNARVYSGNGKQRILNMIDFYNNVKKTARIYSKKYGNPDIILASSVHPLTLVAGIQIAKKYGIKCISEVRDLWPESIVEYGSMSKNNPIVKILYAGERWIYKKSNALIFTMEGGRDYIVDMGWDTEHGGPVDLSKVYHINNGIELEEFDYNCEHYTLNDTDLNASDNFKIIYCGSIRKANNLGLLLDVAKHIDGNVQFLIWGAGEQIDILSKRLVVEKITNVHFKGKVPKQYIPYINSKANLTVLNYEMHDIWKYGGSQNKLFEYFASGTPIMTNIQMGYDLIERYDCGFHVDYSNIDSVVRLLEHLSSMDKEEYKLFCLNARRAAEDYDFKKLTDKLMQVIDLTLYGENIKR